MLPLPPRVIRFARSAVRSLVHRRTVLAAFGVALPAALGITGAARAHATARATLDPPTDSYTPASGTHFTSASQTVTLSVCDDTYGISTVTATLNGNNVYFEDGLIASCGGDPGNDKGNFELTLSPGSNDFEIEMCNTNSDCSSDWATYYYDVPAMTVTANAHSITYPLPSDTTSFYVYNTAA